MVLLTFAFCCKHLLVFAIVSTESLSFYQGDHNPPAVRYNLRVFQETLLVLLCPLKMS